MPTHKSISGGILARPGQYLFGKRSADASWYAGAWDIFGGHIEPGETPEEALRRECMEELGIEPAVCELVTVVEGPTEDVSASIRYYIFFITAWTGGEPGNRSNEHAEIRWFSRSELDGLQLAAPEYKGLIDAWERRVVSR